MGICYSVSDNTSFVINQLYQNLPIIRDGDWYIDEEILLSILKHSTSIIDAMVKYEKNPEDMEDGIQHIQQANIYYESKQFMNCWKQIISGITTIHWVYYSKLDSIKLWDINERANQIFQKYYHLSSVTRRTNNKIYHFADFANDMV